MTPALLGARVCDCISTCIGTERFAWAQRRGIPVNHSKCLFAHGRRRRGCGDYDRPITVSDTGGGIDGPKAA